MRIIIAGGSGFIGGALTQHFLQKGQEVIIIGRDKQKIHSAYGDKVIPISWDEFSEQGKDILLTSDLIINLAGANIAAKRWSQSRKNELIESRVSTTKMIADKCAKLAQNSPPLFNAGGLSIYGLHKHLDVTHAFTEKSPINFNAYADFASRINKEWEKATHIASKAGVRVVNMRFALVLDKQGGFLAKLYPAYRMGLGGILGSGSQPFPWIALTDLISAIDFLYQHPNISGPVNFASPQCITQANFAHEFAKTLGRPCFLKIPGALLSISLGEMAEVLLLNGQCASPQVLLEHGFQFKHPDITETLHTIYANERPKS